MGVPPAKKTDSLGKRTWLQILARTQFIVTGSTLILAIYLHTAHTAWFCIGTLVAAWSAKILKRFIRQPRPTGAKKFEKTYGMPSTHSSSMAYFGVYLSLCSLFLPLHPRVTKLVPGYDYLALKAALGHDPLHTKFATWAQLATRAALAAFFLFGAASVCWSRVRLGHHTRAQVIAGASLGSLVAGLWLCGWLGVEQFGKAVHREAWAGRALEWLGGVGVPTWVTGGLAKRGEAVEHAVVESVLVVKKAWDAGRWDALRAVNPKALPIWTTRWKGEL